MGQCVSSVDSSNFEKARKLVIILNFSEKIYSMLYLVHIEQKASEHAYKKVAPTAQLLIYLLYTVCGGD